MQARIRELKVKVKSLAVEAAIIRKEERKVVKRRRELFAKSSDLLTIGEKTDWRVNYAVTDSLATTHQSLRDHRIQKVRYEQRATLLAYGFLRGKAYATIEKPKTPLSTNTTIRLLQIINKFSATTDSVTRLQLEQWLNGTFTVNPHKVHLR